MHGNRVGWKICKGKEQSGINPSTKNFFFFGANSLKACGREKDKKQSNIGSH